MNNSLLLKVKANLLEHYCPVLCLPFFGLRVTAGHHTNGASQIHHAIRATMDMWYHANGVMPRADYTFGVGRTTRNTRYPCLMGISKRITQRAKNRHADNVLRTNHGNGLQQKRYLGNLMTVSFPQKRFCYSGKTSLYWLGLKCLS